MRKSAPSQTHIDVLLTLLLKGLTSLVWVLVEGKRGPEMVRH